MLTLLHALFLLAATHSAALQELARQPHGNPTLPRAGRAAVVLRGQAYRCRRRRPRTAAGEVSKGPVPRLPCCKAAVPAQEGATDSLVKHVIQPLEAQGNKVDIVVTDGECNLTAGSIVSQLGDRVLQFKQRDAETPFPQNENIRFALETFKGAVPGESEGIATSYDFVLLLRQDITWKMPITEWQEANFSKFNFASHCERRPWDRWDRCTNDAFYTMPGHLFPAFDGEVSRENCFYVPDLSQCPESSFCMWNSGHLCAPQVLARIGAQDVGFVTQWRPREEVREANAVWELYDAVQ